MGFFGGWVTIENSLFEMITMQLDDVLVNLGLAEQGSIGKPRNWTMWVSTWLHH